MRAATLLGTLVFFLAAGRADAATIVVTALGDGAGACPGAACTLRAAIAAAMANDRIEFDPALAYPATLQLSGSELVIDKNLVIAGPGADRLAVSAASAQRVLRVSAGNVTIESIALANGQARGMNAQSQPNESGASAASGTPAEGGCVRTAAGTLLELDRVALRGCLADGGDGGNGGSGITGGANAAARAGGDGGAGGSARGGAIAAFGTLALVQSSITGSTARGGAGGQGGHGGSPTFGSGGTGGAGGDAGAGHGGAIYVASGASLVISNSSFAHNGVASSDAGDGGNGGSAGAGGSGGSAGAGGDGGSVQGGNVHLTASAFLADIEFSTLGPATVSAGQAGTPGSGGGAPSGMPATVQGEIVFAAVVPRVRSSSLAGNLAVPDCQGTVSASGNNLDSDSSCSGFTAHATFASAFIASATFEESGRTAWQPIVGGAAVDGAANCLDLTGATVAVDQFGRTRPIDGDGNGAAACDLGAVEFDRRIFANGFEG